MSKLPVLDINGREVENIEIPEDLFTQPVNTAVIHQAVLLYQASLRQGNASTKERGSVSGGGKKPWRQKGTGRARAGSTRSPLWKKGGIIFGPHPRDFSYSVPKKIKKIALKECLSAKYQDKSLFCVTDLKQSFNKTKEFVKVLKTLSLNGKVLAILDGSDASIQRVARNIASLNVTRSQDVNAFDVMQNSKVLVSKTAIINLIERLKI